MQAVQIVKGAAKGGQILSGEADDQIRMNMHIMVLLQGLYIAANISDSLKEEILAYAIARYDSIRTLYTYEEAKNACSEWKKENQAYSRNSGKKAAAAHTGYVAEMLNTYSETTLPQTEKKVLLQLNQHLINWRRQGRNTQYQIPEYKDGVQ